jgi:DNA-binding LacI/PurR family transcriptional regulator
MAEVGRRFRKATIKDVARHAGVSTTTVSVFVSGRESVCSPETAARIRAAVEALNYTPSSLIAGAQTKITRTIGACIPSPLDPVVRYGSLFFERLWRGITAEADKEDYALLHYPASVREGERVEPFLDGRVDGVLFHAHDVTRPARAAAAGMPVVLLERAGELPEGCGAVSADEANTIEVALHYLWGRGHRRIAHVAGPVSGPGGFVSPECADNVAERRLAAFKAWMMERDAFRPELVMLAGSWSGTRAESIVTELRQLPEPPTAIFCANDALAVAVMAAVQAQGWRVPEEVSVMGIDDSAVARECEPGLTSVSVHLEAVGREAISCLLRLMNGAPLEDCRVSLPVAELVERLSVADAPPFPETK